MKKIFIALFLTLSLMACKKETIVSTGDTTIQVVSLPKLVKNVAAPDGVLGFENKKSLEVFLKDLEYNKAPSGDMLPIGFKSLHDFFQAYRDKVALKSTHSNNVQNNYQTLTENDLSSESTVEEYVYNLDSYLVPDERFSYVLNEDLQVMVDGNFYQITRLETLLINSQYVEQFAEWYPTVENDVMYNPSVTSFQNEISLGNNEFQVAEGITRLAFDEVQSDGGDFFVEPLDASGSLTGSPTSTTSEKMDTYEVSTKFNRSENIRKGDRRFVFQAYNDNFLRLNIFQSVGVKGKVQRQRKIWFVTYWGESFGDEIIVGCENMDLRFDYNFPIPQQYNLLKRPDFKGIIPKYQIGNWEFDVMDIDINLDVNFYDRTFHLHSDNMINMVNGKLNEFTGSQFNNLFLKIQDNVIESFDPAFKTRYSKYTTRLNSLVDKSKYRMTFGYTEKKQGYSHINNWIMDYNGGVTVKIGQSTSISGNSYGYTMKAGSFFGKARIGGDWYKIRLVVKKD